MAVPIEYHNFSRSCKVMEDISLADPDEILNFLSQVSLRGKGLTTENLMDYVMDEGFIEPIYLSAKGEDPEAYYKGQPNAWAIYQIREWKRVLTITGGGPGERRARITETP